MSLMDRGPQHAGSHLTHRKNQPRHAWVKLRIHVYICKKCGTGKVNAEVNGQWITTFHFPTGVSRVESHVPPCERGPLTEKYLAKYSKQISEWKGHRDAIGKADGTRNPDAPF